MNGLLVFFGGGLGAFVRYLLYHIFPKNCCYPMGTLVSNFLGCFFATLIFVWIISKTNLNPAYRTFFIVGFCGGLSTLSAISLEVLTYIQNGAYLKAVSYILLSVLVCTVAVLLGIVLIKNISKIF